MRSFLFLLSARFGLTRGHPQEAETRREEKNKTVHVSWETLYYLHTVNMHGTQNIKMYSL